MEAGKRTINDIFTGSRLLEIPFFQRAYVWDTPQWERLLEDVETVSQNRQPYFMGSVILKQQLTSATAGVGDIRTVVDGQQRLTTISILLKVLCLKTDTMRKFDKRFRLDDDRAVLQHNHNDVDAYNTIMDLTSAVSTTKTDNISRAYQYFLDKLDMNKVDFDAICSSILFVGIDLSSDEDEQQIFDTINSLGVSLTTAELLKNYFFGRNDLDAYNKYWLDVFEKDDDTKNYWDQEITTGRIKRTFIDLFFFSFLQVKMQEPALKVRAEDKIEYSRVDKLFGSYKHFIKCHCDNDKHQILNEIGEYALVFRKSFDSGVVDHELPSTAGIERLNAIIFSLDTATLIPYILFIERNVEDLDEKNKLYAYLESYVMRRLVTRSTTKNYNQLFGDRLIINRIMTKTALSDYINTQSDKINYMPSDTEVISAFENSVLTNKYAAGILYLIESKTRDSNKHSTVLLGISKYSLEHMMPKKWRNHWAFSGSPADAETRDRTLLTLGNLAIITQSLNASIRDADWQTKVAGKGTHGGLLKYADGIETLSPYLQQPSWDEQSIHDRAIKLAQMALTTWNI